MRSESANYFCPLDLRSESANYRPPVRAHRAQNAFTLTELLVVIGIMGMLLYVAMPSFTKMVKGSGVAFSATTMMSRLGLARGTAISKNRYVALLMPNYRYYTGAANNSNSCRNSSSTKKFPGKYIYSATRMCFVEKTSTANRFNFVAWVPNDSWEFLPTGTIIFRANNVQAFNPQTPSTFDTEDLGEADGDPITNNCCVVDNVNCSELSSTSTDYDDMDNVRAVVFKPTGQSAFSGTLYVKIGEGVYTESSDTSKPDCTITNKSNYRNIEVDQFIGRINVID